MKYGDRYISKDNTGAVYVVIAVTGDFVFANYQHCVNGGVSQFRVDKFTAEFEPEEQYYKRVCKNNDRNLDINHD